MSNTSPLSQAERMVNAPLSKIREVIAYAGKLEAAGKRIVHLEIGEPDVDTPKHIVQACKDALDAGKVHYGPVTGIPELRAAVAKHYNALYGCDYAPEEVIITSGVEQGIFLTMNAYLNPGDEILVPDPGYLCYFTLPNITGSKAVSYPLKEEDGFQLKAESMEALITPKTKAILLNSPSNPCGSMLDEASLRIVAELARKHNLLVISDEVYADMVYGGKKYCSAASLPSLRERLVVLHGFSKYFAMTGWRLGYLLCDRSLTDPIMRLNFYNLSCPNTFIQYAGLAALTEDDAPSRAMVKEYEARRNYMVEAINTLPGCTCRMPDGAFYIFVNIAGTGMTADEFCRVMIDEAGVSLTPGHVFGSMGTDFVRVSYANSMENLKLAISLMRETLEKRGVAK
ncbi:pyridoxal phosphate-dependent aminotransferase [Mailhella massiliensis]|uniref:Aminotransferase n=1 Tax=Mailhella massiliensis TaxID=1903261 RepID=A0A921AVM2_9BACT|nr:pyridoxal phosphate-dependent aminotransferase [Mailhella massiliensis]HJD96674.1 pyridoxal phosphate-dependent aminotransferase [Mailhella massiliensis]